MANNMIKFYRGLVGSLPAVGELGSMYVTTDEGAIYYGTGTGMKRLGDYIMIDTVDNLPESGAHATALYYCTNPNKEARGHQSNCANRRAFHFQYSKDGWHRAYNKWCRSRFPAETFSFLWSP
jgi:hypothetical protein